jgi:hypothetical protein
MAQGTDVKCIKHGRWKVRIVLGAEELLVRTGPEVVQLNPNTPPIRQSQATRGVVLLQLLALPLAGE